ELCGVGRHFVGEPPRIRMNMPATTSCTVLLSLVLGALAGSPRSQDPASPATRRDALDRATEKLRELQVPDQGNPVSAPLPAPATVGLGMQSGPLRLIDVSLDIVAAVGGSTERDSTLADLQAGGHDPKKRGFTLQQAELSLAGAVDPWLQAKAHLITFLDRDTGETVVELEEAYLLTQQLPWDLQLKAGTFFTEFGRINPVHPHAWDWQDQPIINSRLFGADGMRGPGARLSWLLPTDTYTELFFGVHNANGETMRSFLANDKVYSEQPIGGRFFEEREVRSGNDLVYTARALAAFDLGETSSLGLGVSALFGPNATGPDADTLIFGGDFVFRWRPADNRRGYPFFKLQGEVMSRAFDAAEQTDDSDPLDPVTLPGKTLRDYGGYLQMLYGFQENWAAGVRVDLVSGGRASYDATARTFDRDADAFRTDRVRVSPMLAYHPSEFSRVRLQYNYDDSDHLGREAHSVWLGFEVLIGSHPPHAY
ncbi:MAG: hypothetical protein ABIP94_15875, partial [Planctomycetota bacterium]